MSRRDERVRKYTAELESLGVRVDAAMLEECVEACGPSIYNADGELVASSDPAELETVRKSFVEGRLGISDVDRGNAAIDAVVERYGRSNRQKYRPVVYYLLKEHFAGPRPM